MKAQDAAKPSIGDGEVLLSIAGVRAMVGLGTTSIYARVKAGTFPAPYRLATQSVRWKRSEILAWGAALSASA